MMRIFLLLVLLVCGSARAEAPHILVLGDSLSAAYGIEQQQGWVALLQQRLQQQAYPHKITNASVSGETTAGALRRLPALLQDATPDLVLIELGANDGLRGQPLDQMQANLQTMVERSQQAGAQVILFEMRIPTNYGPRYTQSFRQRFAQVSAETGAVMLPFFLNAIAADPAHFQEDGIHPTAAAQPELLDAVWPTIDRVLRRNAGKAGSPATAGAAG